ncbi:hypothetical protein [Priestia megaterium]|uniref:hypothetical protein n=1 Tax=Priestia megaterium TaxID=1404 RepID=UPI002E24ED42|nr:hypothetical protein [Priestia megaterium]
MFFIIMVNGGASSCCEDSCGNSGTDEPPQIASDEQAVQIMYPDCSSLNWIPVVMFQPLFLTSS